MSQHDKAATSREPLLSERGREKLPFKVSPSCPACALYNPLVWLVCAADFVLWCLMIVGPVLCVAYWFQQWCRPPGRKVGSVLRSRHRPEGELLSRVGRYKECSSMHEVMLRSIGDHEDLRALGSRRYLGTHTPDGSTAALLKFGETSWLTYGEMGRRVADFGCGLLCLGLQPTPAGTDLELQHGPHVMLIFEETCAEWTVAMLGAMSQSITVATSYATLGVEAVAGVINETGAHLVLCNIRDVEKVCHLAAECQSLRAVVYTTNKSTQVRCEPAAESLGGVSVSSFEEVVLMGAKQPRDFSTPLSEDLACIMYTSGTTGKPKGVMIQHRNLVATVGVLDACLGEMGLRWGSETFVAYLPAAHILELCLEMALLTIGSALGFACPKTIASKGACRLRPDGSINWKPSARPSDPCAAGGIQEFRPTVLAAVPKIWDVLKKSVEDAVGQEKPAKQGAFSTAYSARFWALSQGRDTPLFNRLVFAKTRGLLGGRVRVGISGGGPLSADVQDFVRVVFGTHVVQGYAMTETCCGGSVQMPSDLRGGVVGAPMPSAELCLRSCVGEAGEPEIRDRKGLPYLVGDTSHCGMRCAGRGEVLIRGPPVTKGYFRQPEKTRETFLADGWVASGDIGVFTLDGSVMIVDRVKNLVKLKGGEYIALEAMEKEYSTSAFVSGANGGLVCFGDGEMDRPMALVQVNVQELQRWAAARGEVGADAVALCHRLDVRRLVLDSLLDAGKAQLSRNELLADVILISGTGPATGIPDAESPWTPENGMLTPSNKLNRRIITSRYEDLIAKLKQNKALQ